DLPLLLNNALIALNLLSLFHPMGRHRDHHSPILGAAHLLSTDEGNAARCDYSVPHPWPDPHPSGAQSSLSDAWLSLTHKHFPVRLISSSNFVPGPKAPMSTLWPKIASNSPVHFFQWAM